MDRHSPQSPLKNKLLNVSSSGKTRNVQPWTRVVILLAGLAAILLISRLVTGEFLPTDPKDAVVFQNALLLIVLGSALLEYKFTKPADSAINGLMGMLTLVPVYGLPNKSAWWFAFAYCAAVCTAAMICIAVSSDPFFTGWRRRVADTTNRLAVVFGRSRVLFSFLFLFAVISFYGVQSRKTLTLVIFWGLFIVIWPLGIPDFLSAFRLRGRGNIPIGRVVRTDAPNIIHAIVDSKTNWEPTSIKVLQQGDGSQRYVMPLFSQSKEDQILATGICIADVTEAMQRLEPSKLYEPVTLDKSVEEILCGDRNSKLIGFIDQDSMIGQIRFYTWNPNYCREGMLVWSQVGEKQVYYQITEGITQEEGLESDRHGYQTALAAQLGVLNFEKGFEKFPWLPAMNTPVFAVPERFGKDAISVGEDDFRYGQVPGTSISIVGRFADMMEYHTAILGVTGSGKTELAFDLLRYALAHKTKVICIDLTARYTGRLADLKPHNLSISTELSVELGQKLSDVDTGKYNAADEKKALKQFSDKLRIDIAKNLTDFLVSDSSDKRLGIITLDEISNTKATIYITELFLTCLLNYARDNEDKCPRVLLVVEEAHTVMPEASTMGLGDYDSKGIVAKIAQIALQGRKYGVGLLVIAQRTATVSKTVLTQCNTIVSFSCFDDTSLGFFNNFFGKTHTSAIPNLQFLQAVVFGRGVKSQRPIIVEIPFDKKKEELGQRKPVVEQKSGDISAEAKEPAKAASIHSCT